MNTTTKPRALWSSRVITQGHIERIALQSLLHHGPADDDAAAAHTFLEELLDRLCEEESDDGDYDMLLELLCAKGPHYEARCYGGIGVNIKEHTDGTRETEWGFGPEGYTTCNLESLILAAEGFPDLAEWYEEDWVMVQDDDGDWVQRDVLAARRERSSQQRGD